VGIIALNMFVDFISGGEFLDEYEVEMSFKDRRCTLGKEAKSDDINFLMKWWMENRKEKDRC
jgi:hypothetical protein